MKKIYAICLLLSSFVFTAAYSQFDMNQINFETGGPGDEIWKIVKDTTDFNNIWQIGMPQKFTTNNSPLNLTRGIITDTINSYPVSDTSIFEFVTYNHDTNTYFPWLFFDYRIDCDPLTDFGKLDISPDNGITWYDAIADAAVFGSSPSVYTHNNGGQINTFAMTNSTQLFTDTSNGWIQFSLMMPNFYWTAISDTLRFRFTFVSDNNQTNKQGWLLDNFWCQDYWEGIHEFNDNRISMTVYPNPVSDKLIIHQNVQNPQSGTIEIFSGSGKLISSTKTNQAETILQMGNVSPGIYCCRFTSENGNSIQKLFIKE
jgi:hypothetical protein